jgi:predicted nuclease of predicted toxin-antitoxin system
MSRFLLDMGVSPKAIDALAALGHSAEHVQALGLSVADDASIFRYAVAHDQVVITTDLDFGHLDSAPVAAAPRVPSPTASSPPSPKSSSPCLTPSARPPADA